jgi:hypothetical protein
MKINDYEYPDKLFTEIKHEEYCNLKLYEDIALLEKQVGFINDLIESFIERTIHISFKLVSSNEKVIQFFKNEIKYTEPGNVTTQIVFLDNDTKINLTHVLYVISKELDFLEYSYCNKIKFGTHYIYTNYPGYNLLKTDFHYYFNGTEFVYDNLINLCMIVKDAGPDFEEILKTNLPFIDRWCILDTGSTDGTQNVIHKVLKNKKGKLYEEPFVDFKVSRNRCLELAGHSCKFIIMLDDTYVLQNDIRGFLNEVRSDQFSDSFTLLIKSNDNEYYSNRILKSKKNLRYMYSIHEVIQKDNNVNVTIPVNRATILDHRSDYMEKRTYLRKTLDLELLFKEYHENPYDPRSLYYIAQTYSCLKEPLKKAEYFLKRINHPVEGFIQEKVDALFELARTYNYELNKPWEICERYYQEAWELDKTRPDAIYFIAIHYYLENNYDKAWEYFIKAYNIGYPLHAQYSLKPTLSFIYTPKFIAELAYKFNDFITGEKVSTFYLNNNNNTSLFWFQMCNWYNIYTRLNMMPPKLHLKGVNPNKVFAIIADGGFNEWSGKNIYTSGVGGAETWVIETARTFKRLVPDFRTIVFCKTNDYIIVDGVEYIPIKNVQDFLSINQIDYCIVSRYTEYIPLCIHGNVTNLYIIFHDITINETVIPLNVKIKNFICLSDFHVNDFLEYFPQFKDITVPLHYGIDCNYNPQQKVKNSFIYSSFANRGLIVLLHMWQYIIENYPDSTLHIYCDLNNTWLNDNYFDETQEIIRLLEKNPKGVKNHGWVDKQTLKKAWETSEYWLYPCKFAETFCLTAFEAAASKTIAITNDLGALKETVNDRGLIIPGDVTTREWQFNCINKVLKLMKDPLKKNDYISRNYDFIKNKSWETQTKELINLMN